MPEHRRHGRALPPMLAVPAVSVVKDHVHARRILRQVIHPEELHHRCTLAAAAARIELPYAQQLSRLTAMVRLAYGCADHGWKAVEVCHANALLSKW